MLIYNFSILLFFKRGALTNKCYSFSDRRWEVERFVFFNIFDSFLYKISIQFLGKKLISFLPYFKTSLNDFSWLIDSVRFSVDGFFLNRLLKNYFIMYNLNYFTVKNFFSLQFFVFFSFFKRDRKSVV